MHFHFTAIGRFVPGLLGFFWWAIAAAAAVEAPARRGEPPKNLIGEPAQWQVQSGDWQFGASGATAKSGETLAELSATRAVRLAGRWLSLKVVLTGGNAKAGLWFAGIREAGGEILRLTIDAGAGELTNGRGKRLAALGEIQPVAELVLKFGPDKVSVFRAGTSLAELPITYSEGEATISAYAERGTALFSELLLSGELTQAERMTPPVAPDRPKRGAPAKAAPPAGERVTLDFPGAQPLALKSGWNEYFGVHSETLPGPWKMTRQFDGPIFGFPPQGRHAGDVKTFDGPFAKHPVQVSLADFRDWKRKDARGLDENLKALIESDRSALFIAPWGAPFTPLQQDHVWALMKLVYGANVGAEGRIFFQWGDDINHRRLGVAANARVVSAEPRGGVNAPRGRNGPAEIAGYAEKYFAPAVEAVRLASEEIFRDPRRIPIVLGSCARAGEPENREWYGRVLEHELTGTTAPSLKGKKVIDLVDYLTVNYPFHGVQDAGGLQELWDRHGAKVKGLWVTEEYGATSRQAGVFFERLALYLEWVATNQLTAQQTRLLWNLPEARRDTQNLSNLARRLGATFEGAPLDIAKVATTSGRIYRVRAGEGLCLFIYVPADERRGKRGVTVSELAFDPPLAFAGKSWEARFIHARERREDANGVVVPIDRKEGKFIIPVEANPRDAWALILKADAAPDAGR